MSDNRTEKKDLFSEAPPLKFKDIQAEVRPDARLVCIEAPNQGYGLFMMLDMAEVIALRDWLNQVLA